MSTTPPPPPSSLPRNSNSNSNSKSKHQDALQGIRRRKLSTTGLASPCDRSNGADEGRGHDVCGNNSRAQTEGSCCQADEKHPAANVLGTSRNIMAQIEETGVSAQPQLRLGLRHRLAEIDLLLSVLFFACNSHRGHDFVRCLPDDVAHKLLLANETQPQHSTVSNDWEKQAQLQDAMLQDLRKVSLRCGSAISLETPSKQQQQQQRDVDFNEACQQTPMQKHVRVEEAQDRIHGSPTERFAAAILNSSQLALLGWATSKVSLRSATPDALPHTLRKQLTRLKSGYTCFSVTNATPNAAWKKAKEEYGTEMVFHGTRLENLFPILTRGLRMKENKTALFGRGTYFSDDLSVCLMFAPRSARAPFSMLPATMSAVCVCEVAKHPLVKREGDPCESVEHGTKNIPKHYVVVPNDDHVRVTHLILFHENSAQRGRSGQRSIAVKFLRKYGFILVLLSYFVLMILPRALSK